MIPSVGANHQTTINSCINYDHYEDDGNNSDRPTSHNGAIRTTGNNGDDESVYLVERISLNSKDCQFQEQHHAKSDASYTPESRNDEDTTSLLASRNATRASWLEIECAPNSSCCREDRDFKNDKSGSHHTAAASGSSTLEPRRLFQNYTTSNAKRVALLMTYALLLLLMIAVSALIITGDNDQHPLFNKLRISGSSNSQRRPHKHVNLDALTFHRNGNKNSKDKHPKEKKKLSYPTFPAMALLGISIHKNTASPPSIASSSSSSTTTSSSMLLNDSPPYDPTDFQYLGKSGRNRTLTYWEEVVAAIESSSNSLSRADIPLGSNNNNQEHMWSNITTWGPCFPRLMEMNGSTPPNNNRHLRWSNKKNTKQSGRNNNLNNWTYIVQSNSDLITDEKSILYPTYKRNYNIPSSVPEPLGGMCRPGFLIIGQGKCGTSSLYHYLTGHNRILPASEKQIHYFLYHAHKSLGWYYSHFPMMESFLGRGALMTGEASPGYMPYPDVVETVVKKLATTTMGDSAKNNGGVDAWKEHIQSLPKIIAIVRNPIERAVSSYKYNYIEPAMEQLKRGRGVSASGEKIPGARSEQYYRKHHLFTFEELAFAELDALKDCLKPGGNGETLSHERYGMKADMFFYDSFQRRANGTTSVSPLIHLDGACYPKTKSKAVPRLQWQDVAKKHPQKVLQLPNLQLTQSLIGRGVYALPLEWWYEVFSSSKNSNKEERIHVVCTEDLSNDTENAMEDVTAFLGLPEFDFSNVTEEGRYNVGGHRGYDTVTPWNSTNPSNDHDNEGEEQTLEQLDAELTAISDGLMKQLLDFYRPYNERLFKLIGKTCPWKK